MIKRKLNTLGTLNKEIQKCKKCDLCKLEFNIKDISKGYGKLYGWGGGKHCKWFFVGMNPSYNRFEGIEYAFGGKDFDKGTGIEFVKILKNINIIEEVYVTNLVKCSTKENKINETEINYCIKFLLKEIEILKPEKIITMGKQIYNTIMIALDRESELRKRVVNIWHPNYVISYQRKSMEEYITKISEICK